MLPLVSEAFQTKGSISNSTYVLSSPALVWWAWPRQGPVSQTKYSQGPQAAIIVTSAQAQIAFGPSGPCERIFQQSFTFFGQASVGRVPPDSDEPGDITCSVAPTPDVWRAASCQNDNDATGGIRCGQNLSFKSVNTSRRSFSTENCHQLYIRIESPS